MDANIVKENDGRALVVNLLKEIDGRISNLEKREVQVNCLYENTMDIVKASSEGIKFIESYLANLNAEINTATLDNKQTTTRSNIVGQNDSKAKPNPNNRNKTPVKATTGQASSTANKSRNDPNKDNNRDKSNIKHINVLNTADKPQNKLNSTLGTIGKKTAKPATNLKTSATTTAIGFSKIKQDEAKPKDKSKAAIDNKSENKSINTQIKQTLTSPASNVNLKKKPAGKDLSTTKSSKTAASKASTNNSDKKNAKEVKEIKEESINLNQNETKALDFIDKSQQIQSETNTNSTLQRIEEEEKPILEEPKIIDMMKDSPPQSEISKPLSLREEIPLINSQLSKAYLQLFNKYLNRVFLYLDEQELSALSCLNRQSLSILAQNKINQLNAEKEPLNAKLVSLNSVSNN